MLYDVQKHPVMDIYVKSSDILNFLEETNSELIKNGDSIPLT